ncbi:MAG TPA: 2-C-methyl-D-erythritol 4-phosphate cytidylyltransferase [Bacteroidales bacterium]|nr:2-C-methyl-D-erythritol 4-phosphate cytidylyltransferase [Bacteroidales bacterium]
MHKSIIIVAGGHGRRMGSHTPKQFLELAGEPVLMRTINVFHQFDPELKIVVVLPGQQLQAWKALCEKHDFSVVHQQISGGETRFESVRNGFALVEKDSLTGIHDGVRPLVSFETIQRCFEVAEVHGNAIPAVALHESAREIIEEGTRIVNRNAIRLIQTPQVFRYQQLYRAYHQPYQDFFTDDATVVESLGYKINLVEGNDENIKITTRFDMNVAELLLKKEVI